MVRHSEGTLTGSIDDLSELVRYAVREANRRGLTAAQLQTLRAKAIAGTLSAGEQQQLDDVMSVALFVILQFQ